MFGRDGFVAFRAPRNDKQGVPLHGRDCRVALLAMTKAAHRCGRVDLRTHPAAVGGTPPWEGNFSAVGDFSASFGAMPRTSVEMTEVGTGVPLSAFKWWEISRLRSK
ncbi:MAG: hypothetical protein LBL66_04125 [Clostridiales bacterium]|nr:hypothetical protein [Clostridiales bacterium]